MINFIRKTAWKILGFHYFKFLKNQDVTYLKDAKWVNLGTGTYDNGALVWKWCAESSLTIGNYCSIAYGVQFICDSGYHIESEVTNFPIFHELLDKEDFIKIKDTNYRVSEIKSKLLPQKRSIIVGNDVWIGANVTILPGVKIGNGVTILAGSVVSKDIPDYVVVGGVPASVISQKYSDEITKNMLAIAWWNWPQEKIISAKNDFYIPIEEFVKKYT